MRVAIFSDIHSNQPALEAFFSDVDKREVDAIYCLGDLVGYNVWSNEVVEAIRKRVIPCIAGNHDIKPEKLPDKVNLSTSGKDYSYHILSENNKEYLRTLPSHFRVEFKVDGKSLNLLMVHGSPRSINEYLLESLEEDYLLEQLTEAGADILCFGHTHKPYQRTIVRNDKKYHLINTGSVGKPKDGNPKGGYVILSFDKGGEENGFIIEFIRFDYDVETAASAVESSPLPNEFAEQLRLAI